MSHATVSQSISIVHPISLSHGKNAEVWDTTGKRYIDFVGGIGVLNLGHCHPQVVEAIREQATRLTHYAFNAAPHAPYIELMARLSDFIPVSYPVSGMLTNSGAEAAENALKIVRGATGRTAVIAFDGAFHGRTLATLNLNGKVAPYKQKVGVLPGPVYHLPYPSADNGVTCADALKAMERLFSVEIDVEDVACFIIEPVQGEGGFLALDVEFAQALRRFCDEKQILLIADEIQSGFGRTGQRFAFSRLGIEPDLILLGKSIAGGVPLGAVVGRKNLMDNLPKGGLGGTYSGNPIACAAALATLEVMTDANLHAWGAQQEAAIVRRYATWRDQALSPYLGRLTGVGAMRGIELANADGTPAPRQLTQLLGLARDAGLLLMPSGKARHIIRLLAPLTTEPAVLEEGLDILEACFKRLDQ
ncbi:MULTISPECIES: aspartate aminotransferase family protein [Pseudomonas]|jgi:4-aminobutyrate aminotransferase / (S)-3-amino-2-methylpropionate transaminase / 5-aminovalerate transaminase|uniref:Aspartate aminotransferase family protein n=1 Tax=Pseudomonas rhodesiae TaxID=76760 RepID=A0A8I1JC16_9PSED|nr:MULTISPECIES: aspartate aminotransferase family protein [Pseudomonas]MBB4812178.1 4-aminobutyrate aminotransferase [Pseudomonas rhodesiae]MBI6599104.1 aspartate aminotransferase family protein [Pseudomonas sp. S4_EA_1b]MBI6624557.1 aspartate aminotransferase family protein [Pseudomonas rhodesiae]MDN6865207.1 aspartate aminotransferase family protein [Pseudomonas rhodesiae]NMY81792.1 aspartate aminotransferase family protein [Pseudomonas rhodesiae]